MDYFLKLNIISIGYAFMIVIPLELLVNVYRFSRVTSLSINTVNIILGILVIVVFLLGSILLYRLTTRWLGKRKANFWSVILWIPYFITFVVTIGFLFPITYPGDDPGPGAGLIAIGMLLSFPMYITFMNVLSFSSARHSLSTISIKGDRD